jgi:ATP-dependent DNA helicase RecG
MVEAWGRGMPLILENAPDVAFHETAGLFIAEFQRPSFGEEEGEAEKEPREPSDQSVRGFEKTSEKTSEKIIAAITKNTGVTIAELSKICGVSTRSIERNLVRMQKDGKIRRIGPAKGGRWEVLAPTGGDTKGKGVE